MQTVLITGASRGIGLEFVRQYAEDGWRVLACCRSPEAASALRRLASASGGRVTVHQVNVTEPSSVNGLKRELQGTPIDVLINNAGIMGQKDSSFGHIDYKAWGGAFDTNVMGPMRIAEALMDNLLAGSEKKLVTVSSKMGSIGLNISPSSIVYRSSKAAVNMVMKCLANAFSSQGVIVHVLHPGWVRTDMGGSGADISVEQSVSGMRRVIRGLTGSDNGGFTNYDGSLLAW